MRENHEEFTKNTKRENCSGLRALRVLRGERLLNFEGFHGFSRKELIKIEFLFD